MIINLLMGKLAKPAILFISYVIFQSRSTGTSLFDTIFERSFSLGFVCLVAYMLYKEWKNSQSYNEGRDERMEKLISNNTVALNNNANAIREMSSQIKHQNKQILEEIKALNSKVDGIDKIKLSNGQA